MEIWTWEVKQNTFDFWIDQQYGTKIREISGIHNFPKFEQLELWKGFRIWFLIY